MIERGVGGNRDRDVMERRQRVGQHNQKRRAPLRRARLRSAVRRVLQPRVRQANVDDLLETVVAIPLLVEQGIFNTARRELRYLLESLVKFVYVGRNA